MGFLSWIILGLIAGAVAKFLMPTGNRPKGCLGTIILGVVGAVVGGYLGSKLFHFGKITDISFGNLAVATAGAVLILWVFGLISRR